jgi:nitrite reductase/ring-hydroxylating ferredoxin subunit
MRRFGIKQFLFLVLVSLMWAGCDGTTFQSSVPAYPVRIIIDTQLGAFVHFQPTSLNSHIVVNRDGYVFNDEYVMPLGAMDMYGYGGVVVYVSLYGYEAFDLACPYCAGKGLCKACTIDGIYAVCPHCGEEYDLASGYALPQKSISKETLRRLNIIASDGKLTITQK